MNRYTTALLMSLPLALASCQTVHVSSTRGSAVPVAIWSSLISVDEQDRPVRPQPRELVSKALNEAGVHATVDQGGVSVSEGEEARAREVLLTDKRLVGSGITVLLGIPAGTAQKTPMGVELRSLAAPGDASYEPKK
jgi:hypothetical protein